MPREPWREDDAAQMDLVVHISVEQAVQPAAFTTLQKPVQDAIERALQDLEIPHAHGLAVISSARAEARDA